MNRLLSAEEIANEIYLLIGAPFMLKIVGQFFRPPAKVLCETIRAGTPLWLEPEPENPYDENAVKVLVRSEDLKGCISDREAFDQKLQSFGFDSDAVFAEEFWHLGYVAKEQAKDLRLQGIAQARAAFAATGSLCAKIEE